MTQETDSDGVWEVKILKNGVKTRQLVTPSAAYLAMLNSIPDIQPKGETVESLKEKLKAKGIDVDAV